MIEKTDVSLIKKITDCGNYQPIKLRVERLYGNYFKDVPVNTKDHYNNTRVELVFYKDF